TRRNAGAIGTSEQRTAPRRTAPPRPTPPPAPNQVAAERPAIPGLAVLIRNSPIPPRRTLPSVVCAILVPQPPAPHRTWEWRCCRSAEYRLARRRGRTSPTGRRNAACAVRPPAQIANRPTTATRIPLHKPSRRSPRAATREAYSAPLRTRSIWADTSRRKRDVRERPAPCRVRAPPPPSAAPGSPRTDPLPFARSAWPRSKLGDRRNWAEK